MRCAVIGLGEAGLVYGSALQALGHDVTGYDTAATSEGPIRRADSIADAVREADLVLVMTPASASMNVAREAAGHLVPSASYADFTSSAPSAKQALGAVLPPGVLTADVAVLGAVISLGVATPLMVTGSASQVVADVLGPAGAPIEIVEGGLGDAMAHKLLRSIFTKGLAAVVCEAVEAGRMAGHEEWVLDQIAPALSGDGRATIRRYITGSQKHAARRATEMLAVVDYCHALGVPSTMSAAAHDSLRLLEERATESITTNTQTGETQQ